jgi:uncharacterized protein (DUF2141 family)
MGDGKNKQGTIIIKIWMDSEHLAAYEDGYRDSSGG